MIINKKKRTLHILNFAIIEDQSENQSKKDEYLNFPREWIKLWNIRKRVGRVWNRRMNQHHLLLRLKYWESPGNLRRPVKDHQPAMKWKTCKEYNNNNDNMFEITLETNGYTNSCQVTKPSVHQQEKRIFWTVDFVILMGHSAKIKEYLELTEEFKKNWGTCWWRSC